MPFNISNYKENIAKHGIIRSSHFKVDVTIPNVLSGSSIQTGGGGMSTHNISELLTFRAESVKAPGITLDTKNSYRFGMGGFQKMPFSGRYTDININMLSDANGVIWNFWYQWINAVYNFTGNDQAGGSVLGGFNTNPTYQIEYKEKYATLISIYVFNEQGQIATKFNLYDAYPVSLNDTNLTWGSKNDPVKIGVSLTFKEFSIEGSTVGTAFNGTFDSSTRNVLRSRRNIPLNNEYFPTTSIRTQAELANWFQNNGPSAGSPNPPVRNP